MRWFAVLSGLSACAVALPPVDRLPGAPQEAYGRAVSRAALQVRIRAGDFGVITPAENRGGELPPLPTAARTRSADALRSDLDALERAVNALTATTTESGRLREAEEALLIARGWTAHATARTRTEWSATQLDPVFERMWVRLQRSPAENLALRRYAEAMRTVVHVTSESERAWALERLSAFPEPLAEIVQPYAEHLADTATTTPDVLALGVQAVTGSTRAVDLDQLERTGRARLGAARQRLYGLALELTPVGPGQVDARVDAGMEAARTASTSIESEALKAWLCRAFEVCPEPTSNASFPVRALPRVVHERLSEVRSPALGLPPHPSTVDAATILVLERYADSPAWSPAQRFLAAALLVERYARALASVLLERGRRVTARELLEEDGLHNPAAARQVLDAARAVPGRYAAVLASLEAMSRIDGKKGARCPTAPVWCARWAQLR